MKVFLSDCNGLTVMEAVRRQEAQEVETGRTALERTTPGGHSRGILMTFYESLRNKNAYSPVSLWLIL